MARSDKDSKGKPLDGAGRALDSRWMMAFAVLAVLVAIAWALMEKGPNATSADADRAGPEMATVELVGVPKGAEVRLDGRKINNTLFGVSPGIRHALEVTDSNGRSWRQVFVAEGSLSLVVELRTHFVEVDLSNDPQ